MSVTTTSGRVGPSLAEEFDGIAGDGHHLDTGSDRHLDDSFADDGLILAHDDPHGRVIRHSGRLRPRQNSPPSTGSAGCGHRCP